MITDPQHWAVRLEEFTEYVDADGNVVDESDIDWDTEGDPDAEPRKGCATPTPWWSGQRSNPSGSA